MSFGRRFATAVSLSAVVACVGAGMTHASASTQPERPNTVASAPAERPGAAKPTVVLEHGAWADSSSWNRVIDRLTTDGYRVVAAPNPLRGLAQDAASLRGLLATISGPVVLVGHSYGGAVITEAATGNDQVKALVYIAAYAPDAGESIGSLSAHPVDHPAPALPIVPVPLTLPDGSTAVDVYLDPAGFRAAFAADVASENADRLAVTQRPIAASALGEEVTRPAWRTIPSWFLVARNDRAISPELELFMAERASAHILEIDSSHAVPVSHPTAVSHLIERAARSSR